MPVIPLSALLYQTSAVHLCLHSSPLSSLFVNPCLFSSGRAVCEKNTLWGAGLSCQLCHQLCSTGGLWGSTAWSQPHLRCRSGWQHERWTIWFRSSFWWGWGLCPVVSSENQINTFVKVHVLDLGLLCQFNLLDLCLAYLPSRTVTWFLVNMACSSAHLTQSLWLLTTSSASHISSTQGWEASPAACPQVQP